MKTISIIIVNYNGRRFLERLFSSIYAQTFRDFEVIFVDHDSQDESVDFVSKNYSKVKIICSKNLGYGTGCNIGAKSAVGKYLVFLNEDMYLPSDFLEKILAFRESLSAQEKIGGISCKMVDFDANPDLFSPTLGARIDILGFPVRNKYPKKVFTISGSPFIIERSLFEEIKGFNEMIFIYGEDVDLSWRLNIFGYKNFTCSETFIYHFGGGATGKFLPKKVADVVYGSFISIFTNYQLVTLFFILPLYILFLVAFYIFLTLLKLDFNYLYEIAKKLTLFLKNYEKENNIRKFVQKKRSRNDFFLIKYISFIPAFLANNFLEKLNDKYIIKNH